MTRPPHDCPKCATHREMRAEVGQKRRTVCEAWHALTSRWRRSGGLSGAARDTGTPAPDNRAQGRVSRHTPQDTTDYLSRRYAERKERDA